MNTVCLHIVRYRSLAKVNADQVDVVRNSPLAVSQPFYKNFSTAR